MKRIVISILLTFFCFGLTIQVSAEDKYWIYFTDKGFSSSSKILTIPTSLVLSILEAAERLYFVKNSNAVKTFIRRKNDFTEKSLKKPHINKSTSSSYIFDYGSSLTQVEMINVPKLHDEGYSGKGVLITLIDSGFNHQLHQAFKHLDILAERDFINKDFITRNEDGQDSYSQHNHGTRVLSLIGGFSSGQIIGPAFGATYAFAKTEYIPSETRIEEDNWVAGIEWADSLGTDVVSTSLGYLDFDGGFTYTYEDLNGQTMVTSIAASIAVQKGIVVVTSAGNEGNDKDWPYIISPADGVGVIAVGAVSSIGNRVTFSSIGPTVDGRIKPDIMAMGLSNTVVIPNDSALVGFGSGTSFAAPLVAGVCALLLEIHPDWTPVDIYNALTTTASQSNNPDNLFGYGIIDAIEAADLNINPSVPPSDFNIYPAKINLMNEYTNFVIDVPEYGNIKLIIYNSLGQKVDEGQFWSSSGNKQGLIWQWPSFLAGGVYFAKFELNNKVKTQKIMIFR